VVRLHLARSYPVILRNSRRSQPDGRHRAHLGGRPQRLADWD